MVWGNVLFIGVMVLGSLGTCQSLIKINCDTVTLTVKKCPGEVHALPLGYFSPRRVCPKGCRNKKVVFRIYSPLVIALISTVVVC